MLNSTPPTSGTTEIRYETVFRRWVTRNGYVIVEEDLVEVEGPDTAIPTTIIPRTPASGHNSSIELTVFNKIGGLLSKRIELIADKVVSDGSACTMARGVAVRATLGHIGELAVLIDALNPSQAIALGSLRDDLPDKVGILTKHALAERPIKDTIARTAENLRYQPGRAALVLFDFDQKGMPPSVALQLAGDFWGAMTTVAPALATAGYVRRLSTSAGLSRADNGEEFGGSGGLHVYVTIKDGADAVRFLTTLHARCWLNSFGWMVVGKAGQLLERSIIDRMVGAAERLVFEGPPELVPPLRQDAAARRPLVVAGDVVNSIAACPPLSIVEQQRFEQLKAQARLALAGECAAKRAAWIASRAAEMAARTGMTVAEAAAVLEKQADGLLLSKVVLEFDDPELAGTTVGDVLDDPAKYAGETLADPIEGREDGPCKAMVMIGDDGMAFIHSFAHGGTPYRLRYDAAAVRAKLEKATDAVAELVRLDGMAELDPVERTALVQEVARGGDAGVRDIRAQLKAAANDRKKRRRKAAAARAAAVRSDPRPQARAPFPTDPWMPQMGVLNEVIGAVVADVPPVRNIDGDVARVRRLPVPNMHAFIDADEPEEDDE